MFKFYFIFLFILGLSSCQTRMKLIYEKTSIKGDLQSGLLFSKFQKIALTSPKKSKYVYDFNPNHCHHDYNIEEKTNLGVCIFDKDVYAYIVVTDRGKKIQKYLQNPRPIISFIQLNNYKRIIDSYINKNNLKITSKEQKRSSQK